MAWYNDDGLYVRFGTEQADVGAGGEVSMAGALSMVEIEIPDMTTLTASAVIQDDTVIIPKNAFIEKVEVVVDTACTSGGAATLDVGLIQTDRSTAFDADGFVAALALTSIDAAGDVVELIQGTTGHGALIGTTLAQNGYFVANYTTAAYTAGAIRIRVYWRKA